MSSQNNLSKISIRSTSPQDIDKILEIAAESTLSYWTAGDYRREILKADSFFQVARSEELTIGFIIARLIKIENTYSSLQAVSIENALMENTPPTTFEVGGTVPEENRVNNEINICEAEILNIAVSEAFQKHGVGKSLLNQLWDELKDFRQTTVWLEVRVSNRQAINFYRAQGFAETYHRKSYYRQPVEDALVMKKELLN